MLLKLASWQKEIKYFIIIIRIPTIRGRGALNTPSLNFFDEDDEEETQQEKSEFHNQEEMAEGVDEGKGKSPHSEGGNFKGEKFKR